jgi:tripartite-type tricarboxylate transporter receptor subunit TctC
MIRIAFVRACVIAAVAFAFAPVAGAQDYPQKTITLVNPFPPGGGGDAVVRPFAAKMAELLGQPVIVENKPGATQTIGAAYVARSAPDGYTLLTAVVPSFVNVAAVIPNLPYDPLMSFANIGQFVAGGSLLILVRSELGVNSFEEFLALSKSKKDGLTYGSQGPGSLQHVIGELLRTEAGLNWLHIPFKVGAPALAALLGGQIDCFITDASAIPQVEAGKAKLLAVTSEKRLARFPETRTVAELGYPKATTEIGYALFAPAGTPPAIVARLNGALQQVQADAGIRAGQANMNVYPVATSPDELKARLVTYANTYLPIIKSLDLKPE